MGIFKPRLRFKSVLEITPGHLLGLGAKALLLDVDNTLALHGAMEPLPGAEGWIASMRQAGFAIALVSNARAARALPFAEKLGLPCVSMGLKPLGRGFGRACRLLGVKPCQAAVVGDQLFTDVLGGNLFGAATLLVEPAQPEPGAFFRFKRALERVILK